MPELGFLVGPFDGEWCVGERGVAVHCSELGATFREIIEFFTRMYFTGSV